MTEDALGKLLTEHLPPIPDALAGGPTGAALRARARTRRHRRVALAGSGLAVVGIVAAAGVAALHTAPQPQLDTTSGGLANAGGSVDTGFGAPSSGRVGPTPPAGANVQTAAIPRVELSADGRILTVITSGASCQRQSVAYAQFSDRVVLRYQWWGAKPARDAACTLELRILRIAVPLAAPLGNRALIDGSNGTTILPRLLAEIRTPSYLPPGCKADANAPRDATTGFICIGGRYTAAVDQRRPGQPTYDDPNENVTQLGTRTVHGQQAALVLRWSPPKLDPSTGQPYTDPSTGRPYEPQRRIVLSWSEGGYLFRVSVQRTPYDQDDLITQVQRMADSLH